jgi:hypothetical protein
MDQEREDYADRDLQPPRWTAERIVTSVLRVVGIALIFVILAMVLRMAWPRFD